VEYVGTDQTRFISPTRDGECYKRQFQTKARNQTGKHGHPRQRKPEPPTAQHSDTTTQTPRQRAGPTRRQVRDGEHSRTETKESSSSMCGKARCMYSHVLEVQHILLPSQELQKARQGSDGPCYFILWLALALSTHIIHCLCALLAFGVLVGACRFGAVLCSGVVFCNTYYIRSDLLYLHRATHGSSFFCMPFEGSTDECKLCCAACATVCENKQAR
jgi:hypothetical protein